MVVCCFGKHICNIFLCWFLGSVDFTCSHIYFAKILLHIELGWFKLHRVDISVLWFEILLLRMKSMPESSCGNNAKQSRCSGSWIDWHLCNKHASHSNSIDASCHVISSTCKLYFSPYELLNGWCLWTQKLGRSLHHFCCCKASWVGTCLRSLEM